MSYFKGSRMQIAVLDNINHQVFLERQFYMGTCTSCVVNR